MFKILKKMLGIKSGPVRVISSAYLNETTATRYRLQEAFAKIDNWSKRSYPYVVKLKISNQQSFTTTERFELQDYLDAQDFDSFHNNLKINKHFRKDYQPELVWLTENEIETCSGIHWDGSVSIACFYFKNKDDASLFELKWT